MRTLSIAIIGMLIAGSGLANPTRAQQGQDIDGEAEDDWSGYSVSLSTDGSIVAIGASGNDGNGDRSGHVRIYQWNETQWIQRGQDIDGEAEEDFSGGAVSLSSDGNIVAIGALGNDGNGSFSGHVRIYQWNETQWIQRGQDIDGEAGNDYSGSSVSLSTDGNIVAIGAYGNDGNGASSGHVRIYQWDGAAWIQRGNDIDGEAVGDSSNTSVSLSSDGSIVAIGADQNDGNGASSGHVRIYQWDGATWIQRGNDIDGEAGGDYSGYSVSLSTDGNIVAIGAYGNDGNGASSGHVRIYQWDGAAWIQRGNDIDGEAGGDGTGTSVSLSSDGSIVAIGADGNAGNGEDSGHVRIYQWNETQWDQLENDIDGEAEGDYSGSSVSLSADGKKVAIGAGENAGNGVSSGHVRIYQYHTDSDGDGISDVNDQCANTPAGQIVDVNGCNAFQQQLQALQAQVTNISLTPGPQGKVGPAGADADCVACADVANGAVDLACLVLGENLPTRVGQVQAAATVIVNTLLISTNICETDCDIGAEIDALIDAKMNP
jgi:hypothetical protein